MPRNTLRPARRPWWQRTAFTIWAGLTHWFVLMSAVGLILGYAYFAPAYAHADSVADDAAYLHALDDGGIGFPNPQAALRAGREICDLLRDVGLAATTARVYRVADLDHYHAGYLVGAAAASFCPTYVNHRREIHA